MIDLPFALEFIINWKCLTGHWDTIVSEHRLLLVTVLNKESYTDCDHDTTKNCAIVSEWTTTDVAERGVTIYVHDRPPD